MNRSSFNYQLIGLALMAALSSACNPERVQYTAALKQEMADKKIKRITIPQLNDAVDEWGAQITRVAQNELTARLKAGGDAGALCRLEGLPKTQALSRKYAIDIQLLEASDVKNPKLSQKEREVLDAYLYNAENKLDQISNIQRIADTLYVYNSPVPTASPICKTCFGDQPQPLAVWRLAFHKREVIRRISVKK